MSDNNSNVNRPQQVVCSQQATQGQKIFQNDGKSLLEAIVSHFASRNENVAASYAEVCNG